MYELAKKVYRRIFLKPVFSTSNLVSVFKIMGEDYLKERSITLADGKYRIKSLNMEAAPGTVETIISIIKDLPKETKVLDYGCGQHQSLYLKKVGLEVSSCDILPLNTPNFTQINIEERILPYNDDQFDISIVSEVVEHVENPWDLLLELIRVSKDKVILSTPNVVSLRSRQEFMKSGYFYWFTPDVDYHITPIPYWQLENFCKRHGIKIIARYGSHSIFGLRPNEPELDNAEVLIYEIDASGKR